MRYCVETTAYDFDLFTPKKRKDIKNENIKNFKNKRNRDMTEQLNHIHTVTLHLAQFTAF